MKNAPQISNNSILRHSQKIFEINREILLFKKVSKEFCENRNERLLQND